jgi:hypothetical protein
LEELKLVIRIVSPSVRDIVQHLLARQSKSVGNGEEPDRPKRALRVYIETFPFSTTHVKRELAGYGQSVADLTFASTKLAKKFGHGSSFNAAREESVEILGSSCNGDELAASLVHLSRRGKAHRDEFGC